MDFAIGFGLGALATLLLGGAIALSFSSPIKPPPMPLMSMSAQGNKVWQFRQWMEAFEASIVRAFPKGGPQADASLTTLRLVREAFDRITLGVL